MSNASLYGAAKLLQIQHATEFARREAARGSGVVAFSVHPGSCGTCCGATGWHAFGRATWDNICNVTYPQRPPNPCPFSAAEGAAVYVSAWLAAPASGGYYSRVTGCGPSHVEAHGFTPALRAALYDNSLKWANVSVATAAGG